MKKILALILAAGVGFGAAYFLLGSKRDAGVETAADGPPGGEPGLKFTPSQNARVVPPEVRFVTNTIFTTGTNQLTAQEVLDILLKLSPSVGEESRNRVFRQIIYYLQMLAQMGADSVPVVHEFLKKNQDVDYSGDLVNASGERIGRHANTAFASRNILRTDFIVPPSLRLGLVDVMLQTGTPDAINVLVEMIDTTGRAVEVAYLARVLQDEFPDQYRDNALKAAKELLANPPAVNQPNRIDENARAYLYSVLSMYNDTSFGEIAQNLLVTPEGRIDRQAMQYLSTTLKEQAVPALYAAYQNPLLATNQLEKMNVLNTLLNFTGPSAQANDVFKQLISDETVPAVIRGYTVQGLAGERGRDKPRDPLIIEARLQLLRTLRDSFKDERLLKAIDDTRAALEKIKNSSTVFE